MLHKSLINKNNLNVLNEEMSRKNISRLVEQHINYWNI